MQKEMDRCNLRSQARNYPAAGLWLVALGALFVAQDASAQMFTEQGGFIATSATALHADKSLQSRVVTTLKPLEVVEILSREDNDAAIRVKTHKTVLVREPEVNGKFQESGVEVEGWILKPNRVNIFRQNPERADFYADLAKLKKWSNAANRLIACLHGIVVIGSTDTEVNCALGLPIRTTEVQTASGKATLEEYNCRNQGDTTKCDPTNESQLVTLVNGKVVAIVKQK